MEILKELETQINNFIIDLKQEFFGIRSNRPSPRLVEDIPVECYGQKMTVKQVGAISIQPPMSIVISVWDKTVVNTVAKAIESSNLNVMANIDGTNIRINLPPLSDERRNEISKVVKREGEDSKIKIRSVRDEANKKVGRMSDEGEITEDEKFNLKEKIQAIVDKANKEIESMVEAKIKELHE